ncbi:MAG: glycosyltransferase family 2 protein [Candidatus Doudnabacteria bacterium]|nr:glycosyltransferase family 2 protein [Candidatus Doudnabacteria bacterium]
MPQIKKLSVVIPAYNEAGRIANTLKAVHNFLQKQAYDYEILVVSDGSKDATSEVVQSLGSTVKNLVFLDNKQNHGKGYVTRQGMLKATGDVRLFMDADNSTTIDQMVPMLKFLDEGYEVVIGSIEVSGAKINEHAQWYRRALGHWSKYLIRLVAGLWDIHDTQRGFKLFTGHAAQEIFSRVTIERFGFDIEVLAVAKKLGYKIKELPVVWNNAGDSKVSLKSYFGVLMDLFRVRFNLWTGKY